MQELAHLFQQRITRGGDPVKERMSLRRRRRRHKPHDRFAEDGIMRSHGGVAHSVQLFRPPRNQRPSMNA